MSGVGSDQPERLIWKGGMCAKNAGKTRVCLSRRGEAFSRSPRGLAYPAFAESKKAPPKPQNVVSPDAALKRLEDGNQRYVSGVAMRHDFKHEREALVGGQNPYAGILSCADSRIAPEYAFDSGRGDLFVCRVAGNFAN